MSQFTTLAEAQAILKKLYSAIPILPPAKIVKIEYTGPFATPQDGDRFMYEIVFPNGFEVNAGLLIASFLMSPGFWAIRFKLEYDAYNSIPRD